MVKKNMKEIERVAGARGCRVLGVNGLSATVGRTGGLGDEAAMELRDELFDALSPMVSVVSVEFDHPGNRWSPTCTIVVKLRS